jgi:hypothetical protein
MRALTVLAIGSLCTVLGCESDDDGDESAVTMGDAGPRSRADDDERAGRGDDDASDDDTAADDDAADDDTAADDDAADDDTAADDDVGVNPAPCELISLSSTQTSCDVREQCSDGYKYTYCTEQAEGDWYCQCSDSRTARELQVSTTTAPCRDINEVCATLSAPLGAPGEETCTVETQTATSTYCETTSSCTLEAPITDDISAVVTEYRYATCYDYGEQGLSCSCSGTSANRSFVLTGSTPQEGCEPAAALCGGATLETVGAEDCVIDYEYAASNSCQRQETCQRTVVAGNAEATLSESKSAYCSTDAEGTTSCSCANSTRGYDFELGVDAGSAAACPSAIAVCDSDASPVPAGPIECTLASQTATSAYCSAALQCTQSALIDDVEIVLYGALSTYCQPDGDAWYCQCASGVTSSVVTVEAEDSWDACAQVAEQCPDLVDVQVAGG